jgi:membrane protein YdbS with pleckstrin-like domain
MDEKYKNRFTDVVLWKGKPLFRPYLVKHIFSYNGVIQILLMGIGISIIGSLINKMNYDWKGFFSFVVVLCCAGAIQTLFKAISYNKTCYWITKDAVYIQSGLIKPEVTAIEVAAIRFVNIEKSAIEEKNNAGTIIIDCGETELRDNEEYKILHKLLAVANPEDVIRLI